MKNEKAALETITSLLQSWSKFHIDANKCSSKSEKYEKYEKMLNKLCDLAVGDEEHVKEFMRSTRLPTWKRDFDFYINQKAGKKDLMEGLDINLAKRLKTSNARKQLDELRREKA